MDGASAERVARAEGEGQLRVGTAEVRDDDVRLSEQVQQLVQGQAGLGEAARPQQGEAELFAHRAHDLLVEDGGPVPRLREAGAAE